VLWKRGFIALGLITAGVLLWTGRMEVVHFAIGSVRTRIGQLFGVDRLHHFILSLQGGALLLVVIGVLVLILGVRQVYKSGKKR